MFKKQLQFLGIGDTTIDAFIRLKDAKVHCNIRNEECELCVRFGDKIPYEEAVIVPAVGNAANASVSASRLGLSSAFLGIVGDDQNGVLCAETLAREGVDTKYLMRQRGAKTNYHYVLSYESERTILVKHEPYTYQLPKDLIPPQWIYLSSLGEESVPYQLEIGAWVAAHPETKLAFQPGTFQLNLGFKTLETIYAHTEIFFCNKEEAQRLLGTDTQDMPELLARVRMLGPKIAVITDGRKGAFASDGQHKYFLPMYPDRIPPVERTGAGDAFASTVVSGLALGLSLQDALLWGPINSMSVVEQIGAQKGLLRREALEALLRSRPPEYQLSLI